jgi:two-component system response regulator ArlR
MAKENIIVVDDNEELSTFLKQELECEGYIVEVCKDGQQGLMRIREVEPDLVILDWEIPKLTGIEVLTRLRKNSEIPILMLTAKAELKDKVAGIDEGANDYLLKPFDLDELLARVRSILRFRKKPKEKTFKFDQSGLSSLEWIP